MREKNITTNVAVDFHICFKMFKKFMYMITKFSFHYYFPETRHLSEIGQSVSRLIRLIFAYIKLMQYTNQMNKAHEKFRGRLQCGTPQFNSWVRKIPWRRERLPTPVFLGFPCGSAGKESTHPQCGKPGFNP